MIDPNAALPPWRVYERSGFSCQAREEAPGEEVIFNRTFRWGDADWCIPSLYVFPHALVLDIIKCVPTAQMRVLYDRWQSLDARGLTREEEQTLQRENPLCDHVSPELTVNGSVLSSDYGCAVCASPLAEADAEAEAALLHYGLDRAESYLISRFHFPWPEPQPLQTLSVTLRAGAVHLPGARFSPQRAGECLTFCHPVTGREHTLAVSALTAQTLDASALPNWQEYPGNCVVLRYTLSPELSAKEMQLRDISPGDQPRLRATENAGIIGGADGPIAMIITEPTAGAHEAVSSLYFDPPERICWQLSFTAVPRPDLVDLPLFPCP